MANYRQKAESIVNPGVQAQIDAARNGLNSSLTQLDSSKTGIKEQFNEQRTDTKQQGHFDKNNFSNTMLGRGMARSTIAGTGLAGIDGRTTRLVDRLNTRETGAMNDIEMQKNLLNQNFGNTENSIRANAESQILSLADQLSARDRQLAIQESQNAFNRQMAQREMALKEQSYNDQKQANLLKSMGGGVGSMIGAFGNSGSGKVDTTAEKNNFSSEYLQIRDVDPASGREMLEANKYDLVNRYGPDFYKSMLKDQEEYEAEMDAKKQVEEEESKKKSGWGNIFNWMNKINEYV